MQDKGLLQRTHGGAIPVDKPEQPKSTRDFSEIENYEAKLKVARLAASTIKNGDYIQGSINSLGFPIIDIDSIRKYRPSYLQEKLITVTETNIFTYNKMWSYK